VVTNLFARGFNGSFIQPGQLLLFGRAVARLQEFSKQYQVPVAATNTTATLFSFPLQQRIQILFTPTHLQTHSLAP
jgi:hypothetical protein